MINDEAGCGANSLARLSKVHNAFLLRLQPCVLNDGGEEDIGAPLTIPFLWLLVHFDHLIPNDGPSYIVRLAIGLSKVLESDGFSYLLAAGQVPFAVPNLCVSVIYLVNVLQTRLQSILSATTTTGLLLR